MADARATKHVSEIQGMCRKLHDLRTDLNGLKDFYTSNGGATFIASHFLDDAGDPRTDLDVTQDKIETAVNAIGQTITTLNTYKDVFAQAAI